MLEVVMFLKHNYNLVLMKVNKI